MKQTRICIDKRMSFLALGVIIVIVFVVITSYVTKTKTSSNTRAAMRAAKIVHNSASKVEIGWNTTGCDVEDSDLERCICTALRKKNEDSNVNKDLIVCTDKQIGETKTDINTSTSEECIKNTWDDTWGCWLPVDYTGEATCEDLYTQCLSDDKTSCYDVGDKDESSKLTCCAPGENPDLPELSAASWSEQCGISTPTPTNISVTNVNLIQDPTPEPGTNISSTALSNSNSIKDSASAPEIEADNTPWQNIKPQSSPLDLTGYTSITDYAKGNNIKRHVVIPDETQNDGNVEITVAFWAVKGYDSIRIWNGKAAVERFSPITLEPNQSMSFTQYVGFTTGIDNPTSPKEGYKSGGNGACFPAATFAELFGTRIMFADGSIMPLFALDPGAVQFHGKGNIDIYHSHAVGINKDDAGQLPFGINKKLIDTDAKKILITFSMDFKEDPVFSPIAQMKITGLPNGSKVLFQRLTSDIRGVLREVVGKENYKVWHPDEVAQKYQFIKKDWDKK